MRIDTPPDGGRWVDNEPDDDYGPPTRAAAPPELPNDVGTEEALLSAALYGADDQAAAVVASAPLDIWFHPAHQVVAAAIGTLLDDGKPAEPATVAALLKRDGTLDRVGGHQFFVHLGQVGGFASSAAAYLEVLRDCRERRRIFVLAREAIDAALSGSLPEAVGALESALGGAEGDDHPSSLEQLMAGHLDLIEQRHSGDIPTVPTGIVDLDKAIGGMRLGELYICAGRPGMGKTVFGGCVALNAAAAGHRTLFVSIEMSTAELLDRWLGAESRINTTDLQRGQLDGQGFRRLADGASRLVKWPLFVMDKGETTVPAIRASARAMKAEFVVVDYLSLLRPTGRHSNRQEEVASIARSLKAMARVLNIPVLCLAQLNRNVESRQERRPMLSDLRESGEVEQSAGVVLSLYRDDYYDETSPDKGMIELGVMKNRHGPKGIVKAAFLGDLQRIANVAGPGINKEWR